MAVVKSGEFVPTLSYVFMSVLIVSGNRGVNKSKHRDRLVSEGTYLHLWYCLACISGCCEEW